MTDRVPMKGNFVDSGPSLVVETLSWRTYKTGYVTVRKILLLYIVSTVV